MGTMDLGSWFTQSSLLFFGDDNVFDDKSKYKVLWFNDNYMAAICPKKHNWKKYPYVFWCHSRVWTVTPACHTSLFYPQIKYAFYTVAVDQCLCRLSPQTPLYPHTSYSIGNTYPKTLVWWFINLCAFTTLPSTNTRWCDRQGIMHR
jgi:hypothetical protein